MSNSTSSPILRRYHGLTFVLPLLVLLISACSSSGDTRPGVRTPSVDATSRILTCKATDRQIASSDQCLQDDAACYQISGGKWCTGERGSVCPAGSTPLAAGEACSPGARCFRHSESLECMI